MEDCEDCAGTGFVGDNGPGIKGNREYHPCEKCNPKNGISLKKAIETVLEKKDVAFDDHGDHGCDGITYLYCAIEDLRRAYENK